MKHQTAAQWLLYIFIAHLAGATALALDDEHDPLAVGLHWEASVELKFPDGKTVNGTATREITGTAIIDGKTYFKSETHFIGIRGIPSTTTYRRKADDGTYAFQGSDPTKREYLETSYPLAVGKTWTSQFSDTLNTVFTVESEETVTVDGQKYEKCLKVKYISTGTAPSGHFYLAPGVGNVMETFQVGDLTIYILLKSFSQKA